MTIQRQSIPGRKSKSKGPGVNVSMVCLKDKRELPLWREQSGREEYTVKSEMRQRSDDRGPFIVTGRSLGSTLNLPSNYKGKAY